MNPHLGTSHAWVWVKLGKSERKDEMTVLESVSPGIKRKSVVKEPSQGQVARSCLVEHALAEAQTKSG